MCNMVKRGLQDSVLNKKQQINFAFQNNSFENVILQGKIDNLKFKEALKKELMKHDLNNIDYEDFHKIVLSILNAHAPLKRNTLQQITLVS